MLRPAELSLVKGFSVFLCLYSLSFFVFDVFSSICLELSVPVLMIAAMSSIMFKLYSVTICGLLQQVFWDIRIFIVWMP